MGKCRRSKKEYGIELTKLEDISDSDCVIVAVAHDEFKALNLEKIKSLYKTDLNAKKVLIDVKGIFDQNKIKEHGIHVWRL